MLVLGWSLFGLAGLLAISAMLSMEQQAGSYVSPYGALMFLLSGTITPSLWPWGQASLSGILTKSVEDAAVNPISGALSFATGGLIGGSGGGAPAASAPAPSGPASSAGGYPGIPAWQVASLQSLASQNELSGVSPQILAVIVDAESGGNSSGGVNSAGYGGWFGLSPTDQYPGGVAGPFNGSAASFAQQAKIAASAFASYLRKTGNDPIQAEQMFQTGKAGGPLGEGARLLQQFLGLSG